MAAFAGARRLALCLSELNYLQAFTKVASEVGKIKRVVVLGENTMGVVGEKEETRLHFQQIRGSTGIDRARVVGLLLMAASCLVSLHVLSIVVDLAELVFKSAYFLIIHSGG